MKIKKWTISRITSKRIGKILHHVSHSQKLYHKCRRAINFTPRNCGLRVYITWQPATLNVAYLKYKSLKVKCVSTMPVVFTLVRRTSCWVGMQLCWDILSKSFRQLKKNGNEEGTKKGKKIFRNILQTHPLIESELKLVRYRICSLILC